MSKLSDFDLDFRNGLEGENLVSELLGGGKTVEVKRDMKWRKTGNLYIEVQCKSRAGNWYNSGLAASKADFYAFVLEGSVIMVPTDTLKRVASRGERITCDIEPNPSRGYLITVEQLLEEVKQSANPARSHQNVQGVSADPVQVDSARPYGVYSP